MSRHFFIGLIVVFAWLPVLAFAESTQGSKPFSAALSAGAGYGIPSGKYFDGSQSDLLYFADLRIAVSHRGYLKLGYRTQQIYSGTINNGGGYPVQEQYNLDISLRQYLLLAGFVTQPITAGGQTRGYIEFGMGYGSQHVNSSDGYSGDGPFQLMIAAQGGALIYFGQDSNIGLDFGLSFLGCSFFDREEGTGIILGAQLGLLVKL